MGRCIKSLFVITLAYGLVAPSFAAVLFGDGLFNVQIVDIAAGGGATDTAIDSTTEAEAILAAVNAQVSGYTGAVTAGSAIYNVTQNINTTHSSIDFSGTSNGDYSSNQFNYNGLVDGEQFLISVTANISLAAGDWSLHADGDDGNSVLLPGAAFNNRFGSVSGTPGADELRFESPTGSSNNGAQMNLTPDLTSTIHALFWEAGGGDFFEVSLGRGLFGAQNSTDFPATLQQDMTGALFGAPVGISSTAFVTSVPEIDGNKLGVALGLLISLLLIFRERRVVVGCKSSYACQSS